jgi:hypothetical protein
MALTHPESVSSKESRQIAMIGVNLVHVFGKALAKRELR